MELTCMCTGPLRVAGRLPERRCTGGRLKLTWRFCPGSGACGGASPTAGRGRSSRPALLGPGAKAAQRSGSSALDAGDR